MSNRDQVHKGIYQPHMIAAGLRANAHRPVVYFPDGTAQTGQQVADEIKLPVVDGRIQIPDARIEYELDQGARTAFSDIEVATAAYRPGHLRAKAQAGFRIYASSRDRSRLSAQIEGEHHMLDRILDL